MQLALWAASLAAGILAGVHAGWMGAWVGVAGGCAVFTALLLLRARNLAFACLAFAWGAGSGQHEAAQAKASPPVVEDRMVEIAGQVVAGADVTEQPAASASENDGGQGAGQAQAVKRRCHLRVETRTVAGHEVAARLSLLVVDGVPDLAPGDWIRFSSRVYVPRGFANPGLPDARLLARAQGVDLLATVRSPSELHRLSGSMCVLSIARRLAFRLRQAMAHVINRRLAEPSAGFVRTMVLGDRTDVPAQVEDGFRAAGATHVLSVSGLHLAVVVALVFQALSRLIACFPSLSLRVPPKVAASALSLPACALYTFLTGEAVATVRSALMATMVLGATLVNRPVSLAASIAAAAIILLVRSPLAIMDVSFQLSFASVIGLGLFARWLVSGATVKASGRLRRAFTWLRRSLSASLAATLVTAPLVAHHFGEVTPAAPLGNLVLVPLVELIVLPCGLVGALLGLAHPWLGALPYGSQAKPPGPRLAWPISSEHLPRLCWFAFRIGARLCCSSPPPGSSCRPWLAGRAAGYAAPALAGGWFRGPDPGCR